MGKIKKSVSSAAKVKKSSSKSEQLGLKKYKKKSHVITVTPTHNKIRRKIISKKDKKKMKAEKVLKGIQKTKTMFAQQKEKEKREKQPLGDFRPLLDSLPSLDELLTIRDSKKSSALNVKPKIPKNKYEKKNLLVHQKTEKFLDRFDHMHKMFNDPEFKINPRQAIAEKIRRNRLNETEMKH